LGHSLLPPGTPETDPRYGYCLPSCRAAARYSVPRCLVHQWSRYRFPPPVFLELFFDIADAFGIAAVIGGVLILVSFQGEHPPGDLELNKVSSSSRILPAEFGLGLATALLYAGGDRLRKLGVMFLPSALIGTWLGYFFLLHGVHGIPLQKARVARVSRVE